MIEGAEEISEDQSLICFTVPGKENSKLKRDLPRPSGKIVPPKIYSNMKGMPEKTKFTLQYNTVNSQRVKAIDKKEMKSISSEASEIVQSEKGNFSNTGMHETRIKSIRDQKLIQRDSKQCRPNNERTISSSSILTPPVNKKPSVALARSSIKPPVASKRPSDSKSSLLSLTRCTGLHVQMCSSLNCKTEMKTYAGKTENSRKTSGMKLREPRKFAGNMNLNVKKAVSSNKPPESTVIKETRQMDNTAAEKSSRINHAFVYGKMIKLRTRSQDIKRIECQENPVKMIEVCPENSDYNLDKKKSCPAFSALFEKEWETGSIKLDTERKPLLNMASHNQCNENIEENLKLDNVHKGNESENNRKLNSTFANNEDTILQNYPSKDCSALESAEDGQCGEDLLKLSKRTWSNLEMQIKETCEKADLLFNSGDDSIESITDIMQDIIETCEFPSDIVNQEERNSLNVKNNASNQEKRNSFPKRLMSQTESRNFCRKSIPSKGIDENNHERNQESKKIKSSEDSKIENHKIGFKTKSLTRNINCTDAIEDPKEITLLNEQKTVNIQEEEREPEIISSSFFNDYKNIGFIGKDVDENFVSFEPEQVTFYQPHESQMLLYDIANCVATQGYLSMCNITYNVVMKKNAEQMSPSGRVPFISSNLCIIPEFEAIVSFMQYKKLACFPINETRKPAFHSNISMIINVLEMAERYICWYDSKTLANYSRPRTTGQYPFPLNCIMHWKKRYEERCHLTERRYIKKSLNMVLDEIRSCFQTLSRNLGEKTFFLGKIGTEVDALVYGHVYALFTTEVDGPLRDLQFIIQQYPNLISFACNFDKMFKLNKFSNIKQSYWDNINTNAVGPNGSSLMAKV